MLKSRKYSVARHNALFDRSEYSDGRQSVSSICANILTADTMLYLVGASILSAVRILYYIENGKNELVKGKKVCASCYKVRYKSISKIMYMSKEHKNGSDKNECI